MVASYAGKAGQYQIIWDEKWEYKEYVKKKKNVVPDYT